MLKVVDRWRFNMDLRLAQIGVSCWRAHTALPGTVKIESGEVEGKEADRRSPRQLEGDHEQGKQTREHHANDGSDSPRARATRAKSAGFCFTATG